MKRLLTFALFLAAAPAWAQPAPAPADVVMRSLVFVQHSTPEPPLAAINWPVAPNGPLPPPQPGPAPGGRLTADTLYVVTSDAPFILIASPGGLVSITTEVGPLKVRGKFYDGSGKTETRTYPQKQVCVVETTGPAGRVELLAIPAGVTKEADVVRRSVDVDGGAQPLPPGPGPVPPGPTPPLPPAPFPTDGLKALFLYETADVTKLPPGQQAVLFSKTVRDYMRAPGREVRFWDKDVDASGEAQPWRDALRRGYKSLPWVVLSNGKGGYEGPVPGSVDEMMALLKKYGGN